MQRMSFGYGGGQYQSPTPDQFGVGLGDPVANAYAVPSAPPIDLDNADDSLVFLCANTLKNTVRHVTMRFGT